MWRQSLCRATAMLPASVRVASTLSRSANRTCAIAAFSSSSTASSTSSSCGAGSSSPRYHRAACRGVPVGSGASSPALFRPTRVSRIHPQLLRLLFAGGATVAQMFFIAYERESRKLHREARQQHTSGTGHESTPAEPGDSRGMSDAEAMQVLGLDRSFPDLYTRVQQTSAGALPSAAPMLPLPAGKAREVARQNFERMFALAVKEENMFLAGKLSAAYRVCVDAAWDQAPAEAADSSDPRRAS